LHLERITEQFKSVERGSIPKTPSGTLLSFRAAGGLSRLEQLTQFGPTNRWRPGRAIGSVDTTRCRHVYVLYKYHLQIITPSLSPLKSARRNDRTSNRSSSLDAPQSLHAAADADKSISASSRQQPLTNHIVILAKEQ